MRGRGWSQCAGAGAAAAAEAAAGADARHPAQHEPPGSPRARGVLRCHAEGVREGQPAGEGRPVRNHGLVVPQCFELSSSMRARGILAGRPWDHVVQVGMAQPLLGCGCDPTSGSCRNRGMPDRVFINLALGDIAT